MAQCDLRIISTRLVGIGAALVKPPDTDAFGLKRILELSTGRKSGLKTIESTVSPVKKNGHNP